MKNQYIFLFCIVILSSQVQVMVADASVPPVINHSISNKTPYVSVNVFIIVTFVLEDPIGNEYNTDGLLGILFWSRDANYYYSVMMDLVGSTQFKGTIPRQDGEDDIDYNAGAGTLYWFVMLENDVKDTGEYYTADEPNSEITYYAQGASIPTSTDSGETGVISASNSYMYDANEIFASEEFAFFISLIILSFAMLVFWQMMNKKRRRKFFRFLRRRL